MHNKHGYCYCGECNATASSKCPHMRNVFPDCEMDAVLSHILKTDFKIEPPPAEMPPDIATENHITVTITYHGYVSMKLAETEQKLSAWMMAVDVLGNILNAPGLPKSKPLYYPSPRQWLCNHKWQHYDGDECGYCGFGKKETTQ